MAVKLSIIYVDDKSCYIVKLLLFRTISQYIFPIIAFERN